MGANVTGYRSRPWGAPTGSLAVPERSDEFLADVAAPRRHSLGLDAVEGQVTRHVLRLRAGPVFGTATHERDFVGKGEQRHRRAHRTSGFGTLVPADQDAAADEFPATLRQDQGRYRGVEERGTGIAACGESGRMMEKSPKAYSRLPSVRM
jgi:hypothetical protein